MRKRTLIFWVLWGAAFAGVSAVILGGSVSSKQPSVIGPVPSWMFQPVVVQTWPVSPRFGPRRAEPHETEIPATPRPTVRPESLAGRTVRGLSTWFATGPDGMFAAAGPALRVGHWRGRKVTVCVIESNCITVTLNDWCQCSFRQPDERAIDLSDQAFAMLAPLSRGVLTVTISWLK